MLTTASYSQFRSAWGLIFVTWITALVSTLAALFLGEVMGRAPCVLCWYQRAFMFPLVVILAIASFRSDLDVWRYALPLAGGGWLIAAFHTLQYFEIIPTPLEQCGAGPSCLGAAMTILGLVPIPVLSLIAFTIIVALLTLLGRRHDA